MFILVENCLSFDGYLSRFDSPEFFSIDVWVRGKTARIVDELLYFFEDSVKSSDTKKTKLFVTSGAEYNSLISERFPNSKVEEQVAMVLRRGEQHLADTIFAVRIPEEKAEEYARFVVTDEWEITNEIIERNRKFLKENSAYGIFENSKLVSTANALVRTPEFCVISGVQTHPDYRRRGYGSAVTTAAVRDALQTSDSAILFVDVQNNDAISVYERLGFHKVPESICVAEGEIWNSNE